MNTPQTVRITHTFDLTLPVGSELVLKPDQTIDYLQTPSGTQISPDILASAPGAHNHLMVYNDGL